MTGSIPVVGSNPTVGVERSGGFQAEPESSTAPPVRYANTVLCGQFAPPAAREQFYEIHPANLGAM
jgi:hypothetical protein